MTLDELSTLLTAGAHVDLEVHALDPMLYVAYRMDGGKRTPLRGADVDVDPLNGSTAEPISLTATDQDLAKIYLRYRLYTYQPDEMITMMALAGMNPRRLHSQL